MRLSRLVVAVTAALAGVGVSACATIDPPPIIAAAPQAIAPRSVEQDLDRLFDDPALAGATLAVHVESLRDNRVVYSRNATSRMIPASALKIITAAVAAEQLGWDHRFETRLDATGPVVDGVLEGDLIVVGSGDPTITARDLIAAPLFDDWADTLRDAGIHRVRGRVVGDDDAFDDEPLGAGWAWDYLTATYAAPSGALSYNENLVAVRMTPGLAPGAPARVQLSPPGHGLTVDNHLTTAPAGAPSSVTLERLPGSGTLTLRGQIAEGGGATVRATTISNPTVFFVEGLRVTLASHGITVEGGAVDIDDMPRGGAMTSRRVLATHLSQPLSAIVAQMLKTSQNFYGEMLIKAVGRTAADAARTGSTERGRQVIRQTLDTWGIPADALVMHDGSGLSRYNYASAQLLTHVLRRMWQDETHRGPFAASLPVAGHDGTLGARMTGALKRRVQAKTGTISNVRSLAGYAETEEGERLVFTMIANHFVAPNSAVDAVMEAALERLLTPRGDR